MDDLTVGNGPGWPEVEEDKRPIGRLHHIARERDKSRRGLLARPINVEDEASLDNMAKAFFPVVPFAFGWDLRGTTDEGPVLIL